MATTKAATYTPGPWREPYVDQLPNGLRAVRIDSSQADGVSVIALLPIGDGSDLEINAIQRCNARLIAEAPAMAELIADMTLDYPHMTLAVWRIKAREILARIHGTTDHAA